MNPFTVSPQALSGLARKIADPMTGPLGFAQRALLEQPALLTLLNRRGWYAARVDRATIFNKETVLHALYQAGCFPAFFGFNWDALGDVLTDLSWLRVQEREPAGFVFVVARSQILALRAPKVHATLCDVFRDAAQARRDGGRPPLVLALEDDTSQKTQDD